jgi:beta-lactamase regulating signal transducer with metallopeptidase domain
MTDIFMTVLNMSVTAAFVIAAVCVARIVLQKMRAPKWISYALWAVAGFRLAVPFAFESVLSLIPRKVNEIVADIPAAEHEYHIDFFPVAPQGAIVDVERSPLGFGGLTVHDVLARVWLTGVAAMLLYAVVSYVRLIHRKDSAATPFVYGFIKPKIHIPSGLAEEELRYVTLHEQTHIKRRDHLVKLFAFTLLCVHWFNPLAWVAFVLLCADMEMSCDERVLRGLGTDAKADYSQTLLSLSMNRRILGASPLAFGEGGINERVKNVLKFQKPTRLVIIAAVVLAVGLTAGLTTNGAERSLSLPISSEVNFIVMEQIDEKDSVSEKFFDHDSSIAAILSRLDGAEKTSAPSVQDTPAEPDGNSYLRINMTLSDGITMRRLFLYGKGGEYFIEEPYIGIYKTTRETSAEVYRIYIDGEAVPPLPAPQGVIDLVENFGLQFRKVRLMDPTEIVIRDISENYSDFVTDELLEKWMGNPETAPGRAASSPWPDRIEISSAKKLSDTEYSVSGALIWITSVELVNGGASGVQPIRLNVIKNGSEWKISNVSLGGYGEAETEAIPSPLADPPAAADGNAIDIAIITDNQTGQVSTDGGETWMDGETYRKLHPSPDVVWWTYDEYKEWLEEQKKILLGVIGRTGGYYDVKGVLHSEVWTQKKVDETIAMYEQILESIGNGAKVSKHVVDGNVTTGYTLNPSDPPSVGYSAGVSFGDGNAVDLGLFATEEERLAAVEAFCDEQVKEGKMTRQEADNILKEYK